MAYVGRYEGSVVVDVARTVLMDFICRSAGLQASSDAIVSIYTKILSQALACGRKISVLSVAVTVGMAVGGCCRHVNGGFS